jgi:hypothetical protein
MPAMSRPTLVVALGKRGVSNWSLLHTGLKCSGRINDVEFSSQHLHMIDCKLRLVKLNCILLGTAIWNTGEGEFPVCLVEPGKEDLDRCQVLADLMVFMLVERGLLLEKAGPRKQVRVVNTEKEIAVFEPENGHQIVLEGLESPELAAY